MRRIAYRIASVIVMAVTLVLVAAVVVPSVTDIRLLSVETASMVPTLAVGDELVVTPVEPSELAVGDIVSFARADGIVTHRVEANRTSLGELETKGDANDQPDLEPVPYASVVGKMSLRIPQGKPLADVLAMPLGKVYLALGVLCSILLWVRSNQVGAMRRKDEDAYAAGDASEDDDAGDAAEAAPRRRKMPAAKVAAIAVLAGVFVVSAALLIRYRLTQGKSIGFLDDTRAAYVKEVPEEDGDSKPPIAVDFDALAKDGSDIVGWIHCEGTPIDFPVVKGRDNDFYLRRDWTGAEDMCGSIFVDAHASDGFADARTVVYGHHMNDNLMFACLDQWADQAFYDEHPTMWLLTPEGNYKVELVAGEHIPADSDAYVPAKENDKAFAQWYGEYVAASDFASKADTENHAGDRYVMLSTCAYVYEDARYTLLGRLVPVQ